MLSLARRWMLPAFVAALAVAVAVGADDEARIMRPVDGSALPSESVDIIATAPGGHLELDGRTVAAEEPFPDVFHATATAASPGEHKVAVVWAGGRKEIRIFTGANPPPEFKEFRTHPPVKLIECTQCHGLSSRGRFRFQGGCFDCHAEGDFTKIHPHAVHVLEQCGLCHNAHGSTEKALLLFPKEKACKLCHG